MSDLIRRQDAIRAYCEHQCGKGMIRGECGCDDCGTIFDDIPSADVMEVVRCKDCKHLSWDLEIQENYCELDWFVHLKSDFCNYGERRTDD